MQADARSGSSASPSALAPDFGIGITFGVVSRGAEFWCASLLFTMPMVLVLVPEGEARGTDPKVRR